MGEKTVDLPLPPGTRAIDLARAISERWPALSDQVLDGHGDLSRRIHILINGRDIRWLSEGSASVLPSEAKIEIFPPTAGG